MKNLFAIFVLILSHSHLHANIKDTEQVTGDIVNLTYAWYPGISTEVKYDHTEYTNITGQQGKTLTINGSYLLRTKEHEKGVQIDFTEIYFNIDGGKDSEENNKMQQFMQEIIGVSPSYIIDQTGRLVEITKFDEFQKAIKKEMFKFFNNVPEEELAKIQQFINSIFSREQLRSQIHDDWNRDVGQWLDAELEQDYTYDVEFTRAIPMLGNIEVPNKGRYEYLGRVNCNNKDRGNNCVRLNYQSFLDQEATKPMMNELFKSMGIEEMQDFGVYVDYTLEVITEESTLLPHYVKEIKKMTVPNPQDGSVIKKEEVTQYKYTYIKRK